MTDSLTNVCDLCEADRFSRLADLHEESGDYITAASWRRRALALKQLSKACDPHELAMDSYDLGLLYFALDDLANAEKFFMRALQLQIENLGKDHVETCQTKFMIGELCRAQDVYAYVQPVHMLETDTIRQKQRRSNQVKKEAVSSASSKY